MLSINFDSTFTLGLLLGIGLDCEVKAVRPVINLNSSVNVVGTGYEKYTYIVIYNIVSKEIFEKNIYKSYTYVKY